jgi:hypothetical protein
LSIFGAFQTFACFSDILLTIDVNSDRSISALADSLLGGSELAGIATAWLAFCPPAAYLAWVSGSTPVAAQAGSHGT